MAALYFILEVCKLVVRIITFGAFPSVVIYVVIWKFDVPKLVTVYKIHVKEHLSAGVKLYGAVKLLCYLICICPHPDHQSNKHKISDCSWRNGLLNSQSLVPRIPFDLTS